MMFGWEMVSIGVGTGIMEIQIWTEDGGIQHWKPNRHIR